MPRRTLVAVLFLTVLLAPAAHVASAATTARSLRADSTKPVRVVPDRDGSPSFVRARIPLGEFTRSREPGRRALDLVRAYGRELRAPDAATLRVEKISKDRLGQTHVRLKQTHDGLPVFGRRLLVHMDEQNALGVNGDLLERIDVPSVPAVTGGAAQRTAAELLQGRAPSGPELMVYPDRAGEAHLAWMAKVVTDEPLDVWNVAVDAISGEVIDRWSELRRALDRDVYDNGTDPACTDLEASCTLTTTPARQEGEGPTGDADVNAAYDNTGSAYNYLSSTFSRDSYDDAGATLVSRVDFGEGYSNAFWCSLDCMEALFPGEGHPGQLVFGNAVDFVGDQDVVTHELMHAVTSETAAFEYIDQSGALDESYADVFAAFQNGNWVIGETALPPDGVRNIVTPADGEPTHMSAFVKTVTDNGAVHDNSVIPSRAAYLAELDLGGNDALEQIYYRALTTYLTPTSSFLDNLNALLAAADDLYPGDADKAQAITLAHEAVGIVNAPSALEPAGGSFIRGGSATDVRWNASGRSGLTTKVDYLTTSGAQNYTQGFETSDISTLSGFANDGDVDWATTTTDAASGLRSARSGAVGLGQTSALTFTRTLTSAGRISFLVHMETEEGAGFLNFFIDDVFVETVSMDMSPGTWLQLESSVPEGRHTFTWMMENTSGSAGSDRVWLDDLLVTNAPTISVNAIGTTAADATSRSWTPPSTTRTVRMRLSTPGTIADGMGMDISAPFVVDATAPTVKFGSNPPTWLTSATSPQAANVPLSWSATDVHSGVGDFDLLYSAAGAQETLPVYVTFLQGTVLTSFTDRWEGENLTGGTFCYKVRARDGVRNAAGSTARCAALPLSTANLGRSAGWTSRTSVDGYYMRRYLQSTTKGATLYSPPARAKRVALVATKCSTCGTVEVYKGGTLLKRVSLYSSTTKKKQVIPIATFDGVRSAAEYKVKVYSSGKLVRIEGLGLSQG